MTDLWLARHIGAILAESGDDLNGSLRWSPVYCAVTNDPKRRFICSVTRVLLPRTPPPSSITGDCLRTASVATQDINSRG